MKRLVLLLLLLSGISYLSAQNTKHTIAVLEMDPTGIAAADAQFLTDRLRSELFKTGAFQVVERDKMNAILKEQGFQRTGCTTVECAVEIGQLLNVKIIVAGSIGKIEELYSISLRMIDVQSGMIIKTATQDYRGKLSAVLTEIIPIIASDLAKEEQKSAITKVDASTAERDKKTGEGKRFGVQFKGGMAFLDYTKDANDAIGKRNLNNVQFAKYSDHRNLVLEVNYFLSNRWQVKVNLGLERIIKNWENKSYFISQAINITNFGQNFKFTNLGLGLNYYLLKRPAKFDWYVGSDIGSMELRVHVTALTNLNESFDKTYTYNAFAFKLGTGVGYFFYNSFRIGCEFTLQGTGTFNLSNQQILPAGYQISIPYEVKSNILLLKKIPGSGVQLNLVLDYYF